LEMSREEPSGSKFLVKKELTRGVVVKKNWGREGMAMNRAKNRKNGRVKLGSKREKGPAEGEKDMAGTRGKKREIIPTHGKS